TMAWASPIILDAQKQTGLNITPLMHSSSQAWLGDGTKVMPELNGNLLSGFTPSGEQKSHLVGVIAQGKFTSWFAGKNSPLLQSAAGTPAAGATNGATLNRVIEQSPDSARIILFSSNDFLTDSILSMAGVANGGQYLNSLQMLANSVDYAVEDDGLASIRSRGNFNRTLPAMEESSQAFWEYLNYGLALAALLAVGLIQRYIKRAREHHYQVWMAH
ncbi:MAG TPA: ABC transporter permease, partial [Cellvibrionaceae bacterium]|nr:ABC transporter permease [Cellvibrionaceae bacterium]